MLLSVQVQLSPWDRYPDAELLVCEAYQLLIDFRSRPNSFSGQVLGLPQNPHSTPFALSGPWEL